MDLRYSLTGLFVGFLVGLTGMGGGSLMTPLLWLVGHIKLKVAIGSDLTYAAIMKIFGSWQHYRADNVNVGLALKLSAGSVPASLLGVWYVQHLQTRYGNGAESILGHILGAVLVLVAAVLVIRMIPAVNTRFGNDPKAVKRRTSWLWTVPIGAVLGFLVGITSVGSGSLFGVVLLLVFGMGAKEMVGTDVFQATLLSIAASAGHMWAGDVNFSLVGVLLVGAIPGILVGSRLATRLPDRVLQPTLATILLVIGVKAITG